MKKNTGIISFVMVVSILLTICLVNVNGATNYTYGNVTASNGVKLHYIKTSPNNIKLYCSKPSSQVPKSGKFGINGGFFYSSDVLSIAVNNGTPINGANGTYGSGWENVKFKRGTLVWDKSASKYSVQVVRTMNDISVTNKSNYWAQGGISMGLKNSNWYSQAVTNEGMPNPGGSAGRAGLVYNTGNNIWLVIANTGCTATQFRSAILEKIGNKTLVDGIFLDGSGSAQMNCTEFSSNGDGRVVPGMVTLTSTN